MGGREAGTNFGVFLRRVELVVVGVKQRSWCQWYCTWLVILKLMLLLSSVVVEDGVEYWWVVVLYQGDRNKWCFP